MRSHESAGDGWLSLFDEWVSKDSARGSFEGEEMMAKKRAPPAGSALCFCHEMMITGP